MRNKLRQLRISKGFTQQRISSLIGIKRSTYTNIELGNKNPSYYVAIKIKKILQYEKDNLFTEVD